MTDPNKINYSDGGERNSQSQFNQNFNTNIPTSKLESYKKQSFENLEQSNKQLLLHIKNIEDQNIKLKEALFELKTSGLEKDEKLEQGHKLILSLQSKNSTLFAERNNMEIKLNQTQDELKQLKQTLQDNNKQKVFLEKVEKVNASLKGEYDKLKKEVLELKQINEERKQTNSELLNENKSLSQEIEEFKERYGKLDNEKFELLEKLEKNTSQVSSLNNDLMRKDEEVKTLIKMAQELNNENKLNIDEVTKQSTSIVNMFYNNFNNKNNTGNMYFNYDKLMEMYCPSQFMPKGEISELVKEGKINLVLADAIAKDFTVPEVFVSNKSMSNSLVSMPLEVFHNLNLKIDLLKSELFAGYLREMNVIEFVEDKFNKKINKILNKNITSVFNNDSKNTKNKKSYLSNPNPGSFIINDNNNTLSNNINFDDKDTFSNNKNNYSNREQKGSKIILNNDNSNNNFNIDLNSNNNSNNKTALVNKEKSFGYLDFFENLAKVYTEAKAKIEELESTVNNISQENSILKVTNKEYQEKNAYYEETIQGLKENIKSANNIFENKINSTNSIIQKLIAVQKNKENKIRTYYDLQITNKERSLATQISHLNDELALNNTELNNIKKECEKYKALLEKEKLNQSQFYGNSRTEKSKQTNRDAKRKNFDDDSNENVNLQLQEKDASILEVELDKIKADYSLIQERLNLLNVKYEDAKAEIEKLNNDNATIQRQLNNEIAEKEQLNIELNQALNEVNIINEKFLMASNNKLNNKLNQSYISNRNELNKSRSISPDLAHSKILKDNLNTSNNSGISQNISNLNNNTTTNRINSNSKLTIQPKKKNISKNKIEFVFKRESEINIPPTFMKSLLKNKSDANLSRINKDKNETLNNISVVNKESFKDKNYSQIQNQSRDMKEMKKYNTVNSMINMSAVKDQNNSSMNTSNAHTFNYQNNLLNESFNKESYIKKKQENNELKTEIQRLKLDIADLIRDNKSLEDNSNSRGKKFKNLNIAYEQIVEIYPYIEYNKNNNLNNQFSPYNQYDPYSNNNNNNNNASNQGGFFNMSKFNSNQNMTKNNNNIDAQTLNIFYSFLEIINEFKANCRYSTFKDLKKFYIDYQSDVEKLTQRVEEVKIKFNQLEKSFSSSVNSVNNTEYMNNDQYSTSDRKLKVSYFKEILTQMQKLISTIFNSFSKYNKDVLFYSTNLKKVFDFLQKNIYSDNSLIANVSSNRNINNLGNNYNSYTGFKREEKLVLNNNVFESKYYYVIFLFLFLCFFL